MEDKGERFYENRSRLHWTVFGDVFMRFYHQLSNQGAVVLKEFFADRKAFSAAIADAVLESLLQRCPEADPEELTAKVLDAFGKSRWYAELINSTDAFIEVWKVINLLNLMIEEAISQLPDEVIDGLSEEDFETVSLRFDGRFEEVFMKPERPPLGIPTEVRPVL